MTTKGRSARGRIVDFDLLKIKQQIGSQPSTNNVQVRQDFIEKKIHRGRIKKQVYPKATIVPIINIDPIVPGTENTIVENPIIIDDTTQEAMTKQKARPKTNE